MSFRMDLLDLLAVQVTLKSLLQHHSSRASILQRSAFFTVQLSHLYMTNGEKPQLCLVPRQRRANVLVAQSCLTLCDPMDCSTPGLPVHQKLPEFPQTHVYRVGNTIQPSHPLSSPSPLTFNLSQHRGIF